MSILLSSSSDSVDKAIDEYSDHSSFSGSIVVVVVVVGETLQTSTYLVSLGFL